jgi:hypothetical protein
MSRAAAPTGAIAHRFAGAGSTSYDKASHSCTIVIGSNNPVIRFYGIERLRVDQKSVDLSRIASSGVPLLDSHQSTGIKNILGKISTAWIKDGLLYGRAVFAQTPQGRQAEGMVERGELTGVSAGYSISEFEITNSDGDIVDPQKFRAWDDDVDLTYTATRWQLIEASLVGCAADTASSVRSFIGAAIDNLTDIRARMNARQRMYIRQSMCDRQARLIGGFHE